MSRDRRDPRATVDEPFEARGPAARRWFDDEIDEAGVDTLADDLPVRRCDAPACLVENYGDDVGRRIDLDAPPLTIGRADGNHIVVRSPSVSRLHAEIGRDEYGFTITDRGSTNGTYVNDNRVQTCPLAHGDQVKIGSTVFKFLCADDLDAAFADEIARLGRVDGLTQLMRGDAFLELLDKRLAAPSDDDLAVIVFEVDRFDDLRSRYGRTATDRVLSLLAGLLQQRIRKADVLARLDEARFVLLLETAGPAAADHVAEKLRRHVALSTFRYNDTPVPVRVRAAVARVPADASIAPLDLIARALERLDPAD